MKPGFARDILLKCKWGKGDLDLIEVVYIDRGSPGDISSFGGADIVDIGRSFLELNETSIPYHRIIEIMKGDQVIWRRRPSDS